MTYAATAAVLAIICYVFITRYRERARRKRRVFNAPGAWAISVHGASSWCVRNCSASNIAAIGNHRIKRAADSCRYDSSIG